MNKVTSTQIHIKTHDTITKLAEAQLSIQAKINYRKEKI